MTYSVVCQGCGNPLGKTEQVPQNVVCINCYYQKKPTNNELSVEEKEYLLSLLEWQLADHEGQKEWKKYHISKNIMMKLESN